MLTGGSGDLGAAICATLARAGRDVAVGYLENREGTDRVTRTVEASAHVLAAAPNALILEHVDWWQPLFIEPLRLEAACVVLSEEPEIGLDLDWKALIEWPASPESPPSGPAGARRVSALP